MEIIRGIHLLHQRIAHPVVTIGNFDGVHLGHQKIIRLAMEKAKERGGKSIAYTFRPHPQVALRPATPLQLLMSYDEKCETLRQMGIDFLIEEPFSREFSSIDPETFFNEVLLRKLSVESIVVGYDFAFGKERHGHLEALGAFCRKSRVELIVVEPQRIEGEVASSSQIRQHLLAGEIESATALLGRYFFYSGVVVRGDGRGRQLGFPTANLKIEEKLTLPHGVYATWTMVEGRSYPSVTNVGVRPTFSQGESELPVLVETHLLDTQMDLYGNALQVRFVSKLRDEVRFKSQGDLQAQIQLDLQRAKLRLTKSSAGCII
ncbi:MAG: bifunctional riboflavin kinase/FAD synthetase [Bdellovibrionia bacterium]